MRIGPRAVPAGAVRGPEGAIRLKHGRPPYTPPQALGEELGRRPSALAVAGPLAAHLLEAVGAVHGTVGPRLERDERLLAAVAAGGAEHLALTSVAAATAGAVATTVGATVLRRAP